ncbi:MAG: response regulator transcription factor, partial [Gammaproteobacteria bacterium]|nr:response regulator transcription factor [Gammaproteobacteria bacterium]
MKNRILIVDDHKIVREGLRSLIEDDGNYEVVGEASNGREALKLARQLVPNLVIMDVAMNEMNGIDATRQLTKSIPDVRVLALSMHSDSRYVKQML